MRLYLSLIFALCFMSAQGQLLRCGDQLAKAQLEAKLPGISKVMDHHFNEAKKYENRGSGTVYYVPVVIHVIYNTEAQNLSDELLLGQLQSLNDDFRRRNQDASDTRDVFVDVAGDAEIEFYLAQTDPDGNQTSGITRTETSVESFSGIDIAALTEAFAECGISIIDIIAGVELTDEQLECLTEALAGGGGFDMDAMKFAANGGVDAWDTDRYLNIWVCNLAVDIGMGPVPFLLGFAYPPMEAPNWPDGTVPPNADEVDGVVVHYQSVGPNNPEAGALTGLADRGRTMTHEVGHYLGLRHIWGDGDCTMDDGIEDTPAAGSNSQPEGEVVPLCSEMHDKDSCLDDNMPDMIENYMDYSVESCQNMFSNGQIAIMRAMLEGPRSTMISSNTNVIADLIQVSPNPADTWIEITSKEEYQLEKIRILDLKGRLIQQMQGGINRIDISGLENGLHLIHVITKDGAEGYQKFIKM